MSLGVSSNFLSPDQPDASRGGSGEYAADTLLFGRNLPKIPKYAHYDSWRQAKIDFVATHSDTNLYQRERARRVNNVVTDFLEFCWEKVGKSPEPSIAGTPEAQLNFLLRREPLALVNEFLTPLREGSDQAGYYRAWRALVSDFYPHLFEQGVVSDLLSMLEFTPPTHPESSFAKVVLTHIQGQVALGLTVQNKVGGSSSEPAEEESDAGVQVGLSRHFAHRYVEIFLEYVAFMRTKHEASKLKSSLNFDQFLCHDPVPEIEAFLDKRFPEPGDARYKTFSRHLLEVRLYPVAYKEGSTSFDIRSDLYLRSAGVQNATKLQRQWCSNIANAHENTNKAYPASLVKVGCGILDFLVRRHAPEALTDASKLPDGKKIALAFFSDVPSEIGRFLESQGLTRAQPAYDAQRRILIDDFVPWIAKFQAPLACDQDFLTLARAGSAPTIPLYRQFCEGLRDWLGESPTEHQRREADRIANLVGEFVESVWLRNRERLGENPEAFEQRIVTNGAEEADIFLRELRTGSDRGAYVDAWHLLVVEFLSTAVNSPEGGPEISELRFCPLPNTPALPFYSQWAKRVFDTKARHVDDGDTERTPEQEAIQEAKRITARKLDGQAVLEFLEFRWKEEGLPLAAKNSLDVAANPEEATKLFLKVLNSDPRPAVARYLEHVGLSAESWPAAARRNVILDNLYAWAKSEKHLTFDLSRAQFIDGHQAQVQSPLLKAFSESQWREAGTGISTFRVSVVEEYFVFLERKYADQISPADRKSKDLHLNLLRRDPEADIADFVRGIHDAEPERGIDKLQNCITHHFLLFVRRQIEEDIADVGVFSYGLSSPAPYIRPIRDLEDRMRAEALFDLSEIRKAEVFKRCSALLTALWNKTTSEYKGEVQGVSTMHAGLRAEFERALTDSPLTVVDWYTKTHLAAFDGVTRAEIRADLLGRVYGVLHEAGHVEEDPSSLRYRMHLSGPQLPLWIAWSDRLAGMAEKSAIPRVAIVSDFLERAWRAEGEARFSEARASATQIYPQPGEVFLEVLGENIEDHIVDYCESLSTDPLSFKFREAQRILADEFYPFAYEAGAVTTDIRVARAVAKFEMYPPNAIIELWANERATSSGTAEEKRSLTHKAQVVREYLEFLWAKYEGDKQVARAAESPEEATKVLHSFITRNPVRDVSEFTKQSTAKFSVELPPRSFLYTDFLPKYAAHFGVELPDLRADAFRRDADIPESRLYVDFWRHLYSISTGPTPALSEHMSGRVGTAIKELFEFSARKYARELKRSGDPEKALENLILDSEGVALGELFREKKRVVGTAEAHQTWAVLFDHFYLWAHRQKLIVWEPRVTSMIPTFEAPRSAYLTLWGSHVAGASKGKSKTTYAEVVPNSSARESQYLRARIIAGFADHLWTTEGKPRFEEEYQGRARTSKNACAALDAMLIDEVEARVSGYCASLVGSSVVLSRVRSVLQDQFYPLLHEKGVVEYDVERRNFEADLNLPHNLEVFDVYVESQWQTWRARIAADQTESAGNREGISLGEARKKVLMVRDYIHFVWEQDVVPALTRTEAIEKIPRNLRARELKRAITDDPVTRIERFIADLRVNAPTRVGIAHNALYDSFYPTLFAASLTAFNPRRHFFLPETTCPRTPLLRRVFDHLYDQVERYRASDPKSEKRPGIPPIVAGSLGSVIVNFFEYVDRETIDQSEEPETRIELLDEAVTAQAETISKEYLDQIWSQGKEGRYYAVRGALYGSFYPLLKRWGISDFDTSRLGFALRVDIPECQIADRYWDHLYDRVHEKKHPQPLGYKPAHMAGRSVNEYLKYLASLQTGPGRMTARSFEALICRDPRDRIAGFLKLHAGDNKLESIRSNIYQFYRWLQESKLTAFEARTIKVKGGDSLGVSRAGKKTSDRKKSEPASRDAQTKSAALRAIGAERESKVRVQDKPKRSTAQTDRQSDHSERRRRDDFPRKPSASELRAIAEGEELARSRREERERSRGVSPRLEPREKPKVVQRQKEPEASPLGPMRELDPVVARALSGARTGRTQTGSRDHRVIQLRADLINDLVRNRILTFGEICRLEAWQVWPSEKALRFLVDGVETSEKLESRLPKELRSQGRKASALVEGIATKFALYADGIPNTGLSKGWRTGHSSAKFFQRVYGNSLTADDAPIDGKSNEKNVQAIIRLRNDAITGLIHRGLTIEKVVDIERSDLTIKGGRMQLKLEDEFMNEYVLDIDGSQPYDQSLSQYVTAIEQASDLRNTWRMNHNAARLFVGMNDEPLFGPVE